MFVFILPCCTVSHFLKNVTFLFADSPFSVYSYYQIIKIKKRQVITFLDHEFQGSEGQYWFPDTVPLTSQSSNPVLGIRIRRILMLLGLPDPDPDPLVRGTDPDPDLFS